MSQSLDRLVYMANQIARNLATHHDPSLATADHISTFWDPRMKAMVFDHLAAGGLGLDKNAADAIRILALRGAPEPQGEATIFNAVDQSGGSDAG